MKLETIAPNATLLKVAESKTVVLFSYSTPVAACIDGTCYQTSTKHSRTTSKHIRMFLAGSSAELRDQSFFDNLV